MAKKFLIGSVVVFTLIIVGLVVAISMVDLNSYKPKIQQIVKDASGYELLVNGDIAVSFIPFGLKIKDVSVAVPQKEAFTKLESFSVALQLLPLLKQEFRVDYVVLSGLKIDIKKTKDGKFNYEVAQTTPTQSQASKEPLQEGAQQNKIPLVNVAEVRLENSHVSFEDEESESKAVLSNINLVAENISYEPSKEPLKAVDFEGDLKISSISYNKYKITNMALKFGMKDALVDVSSMTYTLFGSHASGNAKADLSGKSPKVQFSQQIPKLGLQNFSKEILEKELFDGELGLELNLQATLDTPEVLKKSLKGSVAFDGVGVGIAGYDLDKILTSYDKSQNIDMVDVGSFLLAGPLGFALSKSSDSANIYVGAKNGKTLLKHLHVKMDIADTKARLSDVAMATGKNRVAIKGDLDILKERFLDVKLGILDEKNCAKYAQTIQGTFAKPSIKIDENVVNSVVNIASSLLKKSQKIIVKDANKNCTPFYEGIVKQP